MNVRKYKHNDLEIILHRMDNRYSKRREDKFKLVECMESYYCYVAEEDSQVIGFIIMEDLGDSSSHYMVQINVAEKQKGIGSKLVKKVFERIGKGGHISLCVNTENESAISFYESLGFKRSGFTKGYRKGQNKYWYQFDV
tara:strand:+ start:1005 stop:1424 length:420 start_codon:yes stop_codon:yes gene_type:complete